MIQTENKIYPFNQRGHVRNLLGIGDSTLQRRIRAGALPPLERLGGIGRLTGYSADTMERIMRGEFNRAA